MLFPNAMNPIECLSGKGPTFFAWVSVTQMFLVGILYLWIVQRWWVICRQSEIQRALMAIFAACAICGYWTTCLACFTTDLAYTFRLVALACLIIASVAFLHYSYRYRVTLTLQAVVRDAREAEFQIKMSQMSVEQKRMAADEMRRHAKELRKVLG